MDRKELHYHWDLRQKLEENMELLASLEAKVVPQAQRLDGMPHASSIRDPVADLATEISDLKKCIDDLNAEISRSEAVVTAYIQTIEDDRTRMIFRLRFIRGFSWKEVAALIGGKNTESAVKLTCHRYLAAHPEPSQGKVKREAGE